MSIATKAELKATADYYGNSFFGRKEMRFFKSRLESIYPVSVEGEHGVIVTSEAYGDQPRHYAVRHYYVEPGEDRTWFRIDTVRKFGTIVGARRFARWLRTAKKHDLA